MHETHHTSGEESGKYVEGVSPSYTRVFFAFSEFKISDRVVAFSEFGDVLPVRKELEGCPPPTPGETQGRFCIFRVQNKRFGVYLLLG